MNRRRIKPAIGNSHARHDFSIVSLPQSPPLLNAILATSSRTAIQYHNGKVGEDYAAFSNPIGCYAR
jgi:hypothetical protein